MPSKIIMLKLLTLILFLSLSFVGYSEPIIVLTAPPGHYDFHDFGDETTQDKATVELKIIEFDPSNEWPTGAYFGFYDAMDRNNSVHFLLMRNKQIDNYCVAGYRIIENGKEVAKKAIAKFEVNDPVTVTIVFDKGNVEIKLGNGQIVTLETKLKSVIPSVSVSSGKAYFDITS